MFALDAESSSFGLSILIFGIVLVFFSLARPTQQPFRTIAILMTSLLAWRYMAWRFRETIPEFDGSPDALAGWIFAILEAGTIFSATIAMGILTRTKDRRAEATANLAWWPRSAPPQVDILIATYNEEESILERTIAGAIACDHPARRVWVLDDGKRPWLRLLCDRMGARYLTRPDNAHAKAGNINHALGILRKEAVPPAFIAVLDADFVPHKDFVARALALFHDPAVGLVQTPQHFFNPDPIQHNLGISRAYPDEQRFFFDHVQPARDAWSIAFCCGTSSMMRWQALEAIGGFPTGSVTEDFLITLRLREEGWSTVYLNEPLTEGLAPEGLGEYITQRGRWCLGLMQIVRGPLGPFAKSRLRLIDRLGVVDAFLYWATTYPFRLACLIVPLFYWIFGITVVNAPVHEVIYYFLPYYIATLAVLNWISGSMIVPVLNDVSQILGASEITKAVFIGIAKPKGHKFKVTAKGGDRTRIVVQWPILKPLLILFLLTIFGVLFSSLTEVVFERDPGDGRVVILFWTLYNLVVLAFSMAVCVEIPRDRTAPSIAPQSVWVVVGDRRMRAWIMRLTPEDGWIRGGPFVSSGTAVDVDLAGVGLIQSTVKRVEASGFEISLAPSDEQRTKILQKLHTQVGRAGTSSTIFADLAGGFFRRMTRK